MPQPSWSPSTTQQLRKLVAAPYLAPNDWTPRSEPTLFFLWRKARRENSAASRLLGTTSLRFALHGWQRSRLDVVINDPVLRVDGRKGIVDLMLSRQIPRNHGNEREHLVVELKRPNVKIVSAQESTPVFPT
ncbi:hypothetical protein [Thiolapillus sp.]|uniref:hypothetical protein n=2 Tax=Thiolapillus sp. TaxID=2017437 RepID=UPI0025CC177C|nr:hypothetical protein [Thiolapillus sp.]